MTTEREKSIIEFEEGWDYIQKGITKLKNILEDLPELQFSPEEHMMIYTNIYNMCIQKEPHNYCQQLYEQYKVAIEEYLTATVLPSVREKYDEFILRELVKRWKNNNVMIKWLSRFFSYLSRYFIVLNNLSSLSEVGTNCFQERLYKEVHCSVKEIVIGFIARDRKGEKIDRCLLKNVLEILVEVGMGKIDYVNDFEADMLRDAAAYYSQKASDWILKYSCPEYMLKVEECLKREKDRLCHYLLPSSDPKLLEKVETELLLVHAQQLLENEQSGCRALLKDGKVDDLSVICRLYHKIPRGLELVSNIFKQHVADEGLAIVNQAIETVNNQGVNGCGVDEQVLIRKMIELHDKYSEYVSFMNHTFFDEALKEAFEIFCNKTIAGSSSAELLANFCDNILKKRESEKSREEDIEDIFEEVVKLLAYVNDKDLFAEFSRKKLAHRLLFDKNANDEYERIFLTKLKLKQLCDTVNLKYGGNGELARAILLRSSNVLKIEHVTKSVKDFTLAREFQAQFEEYLSKDQVANPGTNFTVTVLTTGYWPSYNPSDLNLPAEMVRCVEVFKEFYESKTQKRRLSWIYTLGLCNIMGKFDSKTIELVLSTYQAVVLLLFNNSDTLSYSEIKNQSNLGDDDLVRILMTLSCAKYKILNKEPCTKMVSPTDSFEFNSKFTHKMRRIKIPLPPIEERKKIVEEVDNDRRFAVDAAIVRIMKSRKVLSHQQLISECVDQSKNLFKPDVKLMKKMIDDLIDRGFLERDEENPNMYRYIA